jgi:DNA-3-methyladenine glycosylase II
MMDLSPRVPIVDTSKYFHKLCRDIIGQQLAGKAADAIFNRFENFLDHAVSPEKVLENTDTDLRNVGLSWAKVRSVIDLSQKVMSREVALEKLPAMTDNEVIQELIKVKGIGTWTAEMFLIFTLGREDVFSFGDLGLKKGFKKLYQVGDKNLLDVLTNKMKIWSPYRSYASLALWHSLDSK